MHPKIFILPSNTDLNRGDQALIWESINLVKDILSDAEFFLFESGNSAEDVHLQTRQTAQLGYQIVPRLLKHPGRATQKNKSKSVQYSTTVYLKWGFQAIIDLFTTSLLLFNFKFLNRLGESFLSDAEKQTLKDFKEADAVFVKGGGFIHAYGKITDLYLIYFSLYYLMLANRYKKKVYVLPNSIGPIKGSLTRAIVRKVFSKCKLVTVRENVSKEFVESQLKIKTYKYPDLGFYLKPSAKDFTAYFAERNIPLGEKKLVGVTLRPYRFPSSTDPVERYRSYISEMVSFLTGLINDQYHIVFFAHTLGPSSHEDDRIALRDVIKAMPVSAEENYSYVEDFDLNCEDVTKFYSYLDFMVGTRFHSVIFALNVDVPSIAIAYGGNKSYGIMQDLNLDDYVIPIENVDAEHLKSAFKSVVNSREAYLSKVNAHRIFLRDEREKFLLQISETLK
jgi:colanic acid/amylovoran biosynthesis protein